MTVKISTINLSGKELKFNYNSMVGRYIFFDKLKPVIIGIFLTRREIR